MLTYEYRGYNGVKPKKLRHLDEMLASAMYDVSLALFSKLIEPFVESFYGTYDGENDLFGENGRINPEGNLTKHLWNRYNRAVQQVNDNYIANKPVNLPIEKFILLPDLSFAAVLRDGTVMVEVDKE